MCFHDLLQAHTDQLFIFGYQPEFLEKRGSQYAQSPMAVANIVSTAGDVSALCMTHFHLRESRFF